MDNNSKKPNNKVNMPKFNLNWMYMIIALMLLGLMLTGVGFWCMTDSRQFFLFHLLGGLALIGFGIPIVLIAI